MEAGTIVFWGGKQGSGGHTLDSRVMDGDKCAYLHRAVYIVILRGVRVRTRARARDSKGATGGC